MSSYIFHYFTSLSGLKENYNRYIRKIHYMQIFYFWEKEKCNGVMGWWGVGGMGEWDGVLRTIFSACGEKKTTEQWEQNSCKEAFSPPRAFSIRPKEPIPSPHLPITPLPQYPNIPIFCQNRIAAPYMGFQFFFKYSIIVI
jgi:hypothetical protein